MLYKFWALKATNNMLQFYTVHRRTDNTCFGYTHVPFMPDRTIVLSKGNNGFQLRVTFHGGSLNHSILVPLFSKGTLYKASSLTL